MANKPLPDYCISGRNIEAVDGIIIHYFSAKNVLPEDPYSIDACFDLFCDLNRPKAERERFLLDDRWGEKRMYASAHALIDRDGELFKLVDYNKQAYHAGASLLNGRQNCNRWTLGVELIGTQDSGFSEAQYKALGAFLAEMEQEHSFSRDNVAGHDSVRYAAIQAGSAKRYKYDPSGRKDGLGDNIDFEYLDTLWS